MKILLTGASGFLGRHIAEALHACGHRVICAVRDPAAARARDARFDYIAADFSRDFQVSDWLPRLRGIELVINAVGIIRERGGQTFDAIHSRAPRALFAACAQAGVVRVIQISALGAARDAATRFLRSKHEADAFLLTLPLTATIVLPSLVFGRDGASAALFTRLATLPVIPLPGRGEQCLQPVHVDDVATAVLHWANAPAPPARVAAVGPAPLALRDYLAALRRQLGGGPPRFMPVPIAWLRAAVTLRIGGALLDRDTLAMLEQGSCADGTVFADALPGPARPPERFLAADGRELGRTLRLQRGLVLLRVALALMWIVTGIVSLGLYPVEQSLALLARVGATGGFALALLYGAAALDIGIGIATLVMRQRRRLWQLQAALILGYTAIITLWLPEFWLHPYGPVLKNLPLLAAIGLLHQWEERRC